MSVSKIGMARLFNLGRYEHVRYEVSVDLAPGDSAAEVMLALEKLLAGLNPNRPAGVPSREETQREIRRLDLMKAQDDESFEREHRGYVGTRAEYLDRIEEGIREGTKARERWEARLAKAHQLLDDLGGAAKWTDAKLEWEDDY